MLIRQSWSIARLTSILHWIAAYGPAWLIEHACQTVDPFQDYFGHSPRGVATLQGRDRAFVQQVPSILVGLYVQLTDDLSDLIYDCVVTASVMSSSTKSSDIPKNHGATLVAYTAFATVFLIAMMVLIPALWHGVHSLVVQALASSMVGAVLGFVLWRKGHIVLATTLHAGGLVDWFFSLVGNSNTGRPGWDLLLASVISRRVSGSKRAFVDTCGSFMGGVILLFGDEIRPYFDMSSEPYLPPEYLVNLFVFFSIPAWGGYVVAIDMSNRRAWHTAVENKERLEVVNRQLQNSQRQQAKIADLGLLALEMSVQEIERALSQSIC